MTRTAKYLDGASCIIVLITLVLFVTAVFVKGFGHDLLLEAASFWDHRSKSVRLRGLIAV